MDSKVFTYVGNLLSNLIKLIPVEFEDQLNQIRESLVVIADLVEDAEKKQDTVEDARRWLRNLKQVAYEVDYLLSDLSYETARLRIRNQEGRSFSSISRAIETVRKAQFRCKIQRKLKEVNESLQYVLGESLPLELNSIQHDFEDMLFQNRLPIDSILDNYVVTRKADDVAKIVNLLTASCNQHLTIVSILGASGVGKTTLAKLVCQKVMALTKKPFDVQIWLCLPVNFSHQKFLKEMLLALNASKTGLTNQDAILQQLKKELMSKKFLLVLDHVSKEEIGHWDIFKILLSRICTNNGNAILVTTRSETVSLLMGVPSKNTHRLNSLSNDECWFILKERAFRNVITPFPTNLEAIGRDIAKYCEGIPLSAKVLGAVMGFNREEEAWLNYGGLKGEPISLLHNIFHHLPSYLRPCFAFCSNFRKGFLFRKEELIWLWMAEAIVESFDMGNKCFDDLLAISLLQEAEIDDYDNIILCKLYMCTSGVFKDMNSRIIDMSYIYHLYADRFFTFPIGIREDDTKLRTLIVSGALNREIWKMKRLRILHLNVAGMGVLPQSIGKMKHLRYLGASISKTKQLPKSITKLYNLRTLNLSNSSIKELPEYITKLHSLETLDISNSNVKELPESIAKLHNLQTLDVSNSNITELPESITKLQNLHTLKFLECKELTKLPREKINNLINLKRIAFSYEHQMPFGLGKLNGLETLLFFVVGLDCGGSIEELEGLNKLRENLKITRLEEVGDKREAERANLQGKAEIQGLGFEWSYGANDRSSRDEEVLEGLQPHRNIIRLKIKYYMGEKWPSWMLRIKSIGDGVINHLVDLSLERCWNCVQLPRLGDLPHLQFLKMNHMGKVKHIDNEFYGIESESSSIGCLRLFPALKSLSISWMENLAEWSSPSDGNKVVVFPCLENLSIQSCPKLTGFPMSALSELVKLEITDCEELSILFEKQQSFAFLTSASIVGCSKLTEFRTFLSADMCFKEFSLRRCAWLTFIPNDLGKLSYLTSLEIYCCKRLRYFPKEILCKLTQLQNLSIGAFSEELDDFHYLNQIYVLPCLEELEIWGSDFVGREMSSLPSQLRHLSVLKSLKIMGFTAMKDLPEWLKNLQSLKSLSLDYCRHLGCLSTVKIIRHLSNIRDLYIGCCPILVGSKYRLLLSLYSRKIKVEFSDVSKVRERLVLGLLVE